MRMHFDIGLLTTSLLQRAGFFSRVFRGPVIQKQVSLTLGKLKIQSKFSKNFVVKLKIFFHESCLNRLKFSFQKF